MRGCSFSRVWGAGRADQDLGIGVQTGWGARGDVSMSMELKLGGHAGHNSAGAREVCPCGRSRGAARPAVSTVRTEVGHDDLLDEKRNPRRAYMKVGVPGHQTLTVAVAWTVGVRVELRCQTRERRFRMGCLRLPRGSFWLLRSCHGEVEISPPRARLTCPRDV